jgi:hypothetical protein
MGSSYPYQFLLEKTGNRLLGTDQARKVACSSGQGWFFEEQLHRADEMTLALLEMLGELVIHGWDLLFLTLSHDFSFSRY